MNIFEKLLGKKREPTPEELEEQERQRQETIMRERIKKGEGFSLLPYKCTAGKVTIGYGHNLQDCGISREIAESLLDQDITDAKLDLFEAFPWIREMDYARQGVMIEMVFNMGIKRFKGFKKMLAACQKGEWDKAADEMLDSEWHKQVKKRAETLAEIIRKGK